MGVTIQKGAVMRWVDSENDAPPAWALTTSSDISPSGEVTVAMAFSAIVCLIGLILSGDMEGIHRGTRSHTAVPEANCPFRLIWGYRPLPNSHN